MYDYAPDAPTQPIPVVEGPDASLRLPLVRLAAVGAVSILSGALIVAAQDWKAATASEPAFARVVGWAAAAMCLLAGTACLLGLAGFGLWSAVAAVNRRADQRRAAVEQSARDARQADLARVQRLTAVLARAGADQQEPSAPADLHLLRYEPRSAGAGRGRAG
jgi:hypothetical protein